MEQKDNEQKKPESLIKNRNERAGEQKKKPGIKGTPVKKETSKHIKPEKESQKLRGKTGKERFVVTSNFGKPAIENDNFDQPEGYLKPGQIIHEETVASATIMQFKADIAFQFKNRFKATVIYLTTILLVVICTITGIFIVGGNVTALNKTNADLSMRNSEIEGKIFEKNMTYFNDVLLSSIPKDTLKRIALRYYLYTITVNGIYAGKAKTDLSTPQANIVIKEVYADPANDLLPKDIIKLGSVFASEKPGVKFPDTATKPKIETVPIKNGYEYRITFTDMKPGHIATIIFEDEILMRKLGLDEPILEFIYAGGNENG